MNGRQLIFSCNESLFKFEIQGTVGFISAFIEQRKEKLKTKQIEEPFHTMIFYFNPNLAISISFFALLTESFSPFLKQHIRHQSAEIEKCK